MPKLPGISQHDAVRVFEKIGFRIKRQRKHIVMARGRDILIIPRHNPIDACTMGGIAKTAGLTPAAVQGAIVTVPTFTGLPEWMGNGVLMAGGMDECIYAVSA
jgi:predicted RNA binding protein YcfA (HicA-like mRNA interferase family)